MSSANNNGDDSYDENTCVVCFKNVDIFSIGDCDHPVCYECSTRMRVLCRQNECPICRHDMQKVIFTKSVQPFKQLNAKIGTKHLRDQKFKIVFESVDVQRAYDTLLAHVCSKCPGRHAFQTFAHLRDHMRKEHELFYCDLCIDNLKILTHERRCYTRKELATHRRQGDPDNRSHRGHPLCEFCDHRYMDNDELYRHLRRDHLFCHFCDIDGLHQYYNSYDVLRDHFREKHYLCEDGECYHEKFTSAFRTEIDLKAHRASVHGRQMTKAAAKQARTLELAFTLKPRPFQADSRRGGGGRNTTRYNNSDEDEGAVGGASSTAQYQRPQQVTSAPTFSKINTASNDEFPSLGGGGGAPLAQGVHFRKPGVTIRAGGSLAMTDEDFPALGPEATASVSLRVNSAGPRGGSGSSKPTNVSIHVNTRPSRKDPFPALGATAPSQTPQWSAVRDPEPQHSTAKNRTYQPAPKPSQPRAKSFHFDEDFPVHNNFPTLSGNVPSHIASLASSQWSSGREPEPKVSVNKSKPTQSPPKPPQPKTFHIEDDFPSLSNRFNSNCNVSQKSKPSQPSTAYPKKESSISISVDNEWAKATKNSVSNDVSSDSDIGSKKSSKKKKKKSNAKNDSSSQPSKSTQGKTVNSNSSHNNNNEVPKKSKDSKTKAKQNKATEQSVDHAIMNNSVDKQKPNDTMERKRSELKIESLNGQENRENAVNLNDFPRLNNSRLPPGFAREKTPAPPGFESPAVSAQPPPGFSIVLNSVARPAANHLTFTSSSGQNYPIGPGAVTSSGDGRVYEYVAPPGCKSRNVELVRLVTEALAGPHLMDQFLAWSGEFRRGSLSADGYYRNCRDTMGPAAFHRLFPELIVLLPDINKQQELWKASERLSEWRLNVCAACGQVVAATDFKSHHGTHSLDNHFPTLTNGVAGPNAWHK